MLKIYAAGITLGVVMAFWSWATILLACGATL